MEVHVWDVRTYCMKHTTPPSPLFDEYTCVNIDEFDLQIGNYSLNYSLSTHSLCIIILSPSTDWRRLRNGVVWVCVLICVSVLVITGRLLHKSHDWHPSGRMLDESKLPTEWLWVYQVVLHESQDQILVQTVLCQIRSTVEVGVAVFNAIINL